MHKITFTAWPDEKSDIINDINKRGKIPIIAGGTNYYIEGILWEFLLKSEGSADYNDGIRNELEKKCSADLHCMLKDVDLEMALKLHPNDKRKIVRALEVYKRTNIKLSDHHSQQKRKRGSSQFGGSIRFPNSCLLWVQCQPEILMERIYRRVDKMISAGLLQELLEFHDKYNTERVSKEETADYKHGIFQSIGFKEFHEYLVSGANDKKLLTASIERMKLSTWQYAKYQNKWISKRIVNRANPLPVYALDGSFPEHWEERVLLPSLRIIANKFPPLQFICDDINLKTKQLNEDNLQPISVLPKSTTSCDSNRHIVCDVCGGRSIPLLSWDQHLKSRKHRNCLKKTQQQMNNTSCVSKNSDVNHLEGTSICDICNGRNIPLSKWDNHCKSKKHRKLFHKARNAEAKV